MITFQFGNKQITIPGSYARTQGATNTPSSGVDFGTVLMIDTGTFASNWGGGSGINGELLQGKSAINTFADLEEAQTVLMGGLGYQAVKKVFVPYDISTPGAPRIKFIKAATTTCAYVPYALENVSFKIKAKNEGPGGNGIKDSVTNLLAKGYGSLFKAGTVANSVQLVIYVGSFTGNDAYGMPYNTVKSANTTPQILAQSENLFDTIDLLNFFKTDVYFKQWFTYSDFVITAPVTTTTTASIFDTIETFGGSASTTAEQVTTTLGAPNQTILFEFNKITTISGTPVTMNLVNGSGTILAVVDFPSDYLGHLFRYTDSNGVTHTTNFVSGNLTITNVSDVPTTVGDPEVAYPITMNDLANNVAMSLFTGGTEVYNASDYDDLLEAIVDEDYTAVIVDNYGIDLSPADKGATSTNNLKLQYHLVNEARFKRYMYVGGGKNKNEFDTSTGSTGIANFYNSEYVIVPHGDFYENVKVGVEVHYPSLIKACAVCGLFMGQLPQTPGTFKTIKADREEHVLSTKEKVVALKNGVLVTNKDEDFLVPGSTVLQSINSLGKGKNEQFINTPEGSSYEISVEHILSYLNKKIVINSKQELLGQKTGPTRSTLDEATLQTWVEEFLKKNTSTDTENRLLKYWENVIVKLSQDAYLISFSAEPNYPVNKLLFTAFAIDRSLNPVNISNLQQ
jgi:hypothetical protein